MSSTRISRRVNAPRAAVYRALLGARAVATWMVPTGMTSHVHAFDAREGGSFRNSPIAEQQSIAAAAISSPRLWQPRLPPPLLLSGIPHALHRT